MKGQKIINVGTKMGNKYKWYFEENNKNVTTLHRREIHCPLNINNVGPYFLL